MKRGSGGPARAPVARALALGVALPFVAGAIAVGGFAPFYLWQLPLAALAALFFVWSRAETRGAAALAGLAFGLGVFLGGVSWVYVSLHDFGGLPAWLAGFATFLLCLYLALFPATAGWLTVRFARPPALRLALAPAAFTLCEWLRGWLFTGFPWLTMGTSQVPASPFTGYAPVLGVYGTTFVIAGVAALVVAAFSRDLFAPRVRLALGAGFVALYAGGIALQSVEWTEPAGSPISVALLQGNIPQEMKWRDEVRARTLEDYRRMVIEANAKVVILPETALPAFLDQLPHEYLESLRENARKARKEIVMGVVEREGRGREEKYWNSVLVLTAPKYTAYRKRHLVPFGEYVPWGFRWFVDMMNIPMGDFELGARKQGALPVDGTAFGVAICYEDVFGEEVIDALPGAQVLLNVSNDAWFGHSWAAEQHLQASQARALETGRWMVRATNTGATAAVDDRGNVAERLEEFTRGTLVAAVQPRTGMTPYARTGNAAVLALVLALAIAVAWRARVAARRGAPG